jgi:putative ABC transport system substrate-binding protein
LIQSRWTAAFVQRLQELGWGDGRNVVIEYRWAEDRTDRFAEIAAEFVKLKVDVILAHNTPPVLAAKQATSTIPIVFATASDPVSTGVVAGLARPGGNVTGLSSQGPDIAGKRIELLREVFPNIRRFAILANASNPYVQIALSEAHDAIRNFGLESATFDIQRAEDIVSAFEGLQGRVDALYVAADPLVFSNRIHINNLALKMRLPTMHTVREYVEAGGLMSYGPSWEDMWRRAAHYVDKVLRGAKPADLPVEQPTKFELVINLKTAKALGLSVPPKLLFTADEVIE